MKNKRMYKIVPAMLALAIVVSMFSFIGCSAPVVEQFSEESLKVETFEDSVITLASGETVAEGGVLKQLVTASVDVSESYVEQVQFLWSVSWADPAVTLKLSDYIKIESFGPNNNTCRIICSAPFVDDVFVICRIRGTELEAVCRVSYQGIPTAIAFEQGDITSVNLWYKDFLQNIHEPEVWHLFEGQTYNIPIDLQNIFGSNAGYGYEPDFSITVTYVDSFKLHLKKIDEQGNIVEENETHWLRPVFDMGKIILGDSDTYSLKTTLAKLSIEGQSLKIEPLCAVENVSMYGASRPHQFTAKFNGHGSLVQGMNIPTYYFTVTVTENKSGVSQDLHFTIVSPFSNFAIDNATVIF